MSAPATRAFARAPGHRSARAEAADDRAGNKTESYPARNDNPVVTTRPTWPAWATAVLIVGGIARPGWQWTACGLPGAGRV